MLSMSSKQYLFKGLTPDGYSFSRKLEDPKQFENVKVSEARWTEDESGVSVYLEANGIVKPTAGTLKRYGTKWHEMIKDPLLSQAVFDTIDLT